MKLLNSKTFFQYLTNTSWLMAERIIRLGLSFSVSAYVARYLGPGQFGLLSYVISFVALFFPLISLGMDGILSKEFVKNHFRDEELIGTGHIIKFFGALFALIPTFIISWYFLKSDSETLALILVMSFCSIFRAFNGIEFYFQSKVQAKYVAIAQFVSFFTSSILKLLAIFTEAPLILFVWAYGIEFLSLALADFIYSLIHEKSYLKGRWNTEVAKLLFKESLPLFLAQIVMTANMRIDQILMKDMLGNEALGNYSIAVRLSEVTYFIPMSIQISIYPFMSKHFFSKDQSTYEHYLKIFLCCFFYFFLFLGLITNLWGKEFIALIFGHKYDMAHKALVIHIFSGIFISFSILFCQKYVLEEQNHKTFWAYSAALITNIILNLTLVPILGIQGAALSVLISSAMIILSVALFIDKKVGILALESIFYWKGLKRFLQK